MLPGLIIGILMYFYYDFDKNSSLPNINTEEWWGTSPIDMKSYEEIHPYSIEFPDVVVEDLKERLLHRRPFTAPLQEAGFTYGFNSYFLTRVLDFWQNGYNFKNRETYLNRYQHYITNIQGLNIHYIHVRPETPPNVVKVPILLIHGWPSSIREFYDIIPLLISHYTNLDFVFEVIIPSLPGCGFSEAPSRAGMGPLHIAVILNNLMKRIGHNKYYVHGGGFGHAVGSVMATAFPTNVYGFHFNTPSNHFKLETNDIVYRILDTIWPTDNKHPVIEHTNILEVSGYYQYYLQPTKPDTIGISLSESPAGLAAYILEKYASSPDSLKASDGGLLNKYSLTQLLDNVMIYWVTNSITTTMRLYTEYYSNMVVMDQIKTLVPTWSIKFKHNIHFTPEDSLKTKYYNLLGSTVVEDGSQFPAMDHPKILVDDIYKAIAIFRRFYTQTVKEEPQPSPKTPETEPEPNKHLVSENTIEQTSKTVYDFTVKDIEGHEVKLEKYRGKVLIIVNVASQCGYTDTHYTELNELYEKYSDKGLRILAFPCNQFGGQEPGSPMEIMQFTRKRNVKFDLFEKIEVNGANTHPLWDFLKNTQRGTMGDFIKWNFSKFIIDRNGIPVGRFGPNVNPVDLEPYLADYW